MARSRAMELGFMLDVARDRVPSTAHLSWLVETLGRLGYDQLQLYTEHTFAYEDHEAVWRDASPVTGGELAELDTVCASAGIELVVNLNTFGHMERWLAHEAHVGRAECPDGFADPLRGGAHRSPTCLAPTPANAELAVALAREQASHVRSRRINVGGDEPWELGMGVSADAVAERGRAAVFVEHLARIIEPLAADGREVLFWGDVLRRHGELVDELPPAAVPIVWHYEAPDRSGASLLDRMPDELRDQLGLPDDAAHGFEAHVRPFRDLDRPVWLAPGTSSWNSLLGRWPNARANIDDAWSVANDVAAAGILLTDWGDNGHLQPPVVSVLPMAHLAVVAGRAAGDPEAVVDELLELDGAGEWLARLGALSDRTGRSGFNASPLFAAGVPGGGVIAFGRPDPEQLAGTLDVLDRARAWLDAQDPATDAGAAAVEGLRAAVEISRLGAWELGAECGLAVPDERARGDHRRDAIARQREAWLRTSRPGGLDDSLARLR